MAAPTKLNLKIYQGSTFTEAIRWESSTKVYKAISGIPKAAPTVINVVGHGIKPGWRFKVSNVLGMVDINSSEYYIASEVATDAITINALNSLGFKDYISGGVVEYNQPVSLIGYTARMQLRAKVDSTEILAEYSTTDGTIILDTTNNIINIIVDAITTAAYTFSSAVYSLELVSGTGVVTQLTNGNISIVKEVTR